MANAKTGRTSTDYSNFEGVSVDTDPGAAGFWSDPVIGHQGNNNKLYLEITAVNGTTFSLKYLSQGETTYATYDTYTAVGSYVIDSPAGTQWVVGIEDDKQGTAGAARISWSN